MAGSRLHLSCGTAAVREGSEKRTRGAVAAVAAATTTETGQGRCISESLRVDLEVLTCGCLWWGSCRQLLCSSVQVFLAGTQRRTHDDSHATTAHMKPDNSHT